jgi:hypothetical protein
MPKMDLTTQTLPAFLARIETIGDDSQRQWGTMTPAQMFAHLDLSVKAGIGEIEVTDRSTLAFRVLRPLLFSGLIPMPKGKAKTAPEYLATSTGTTEEEKAKLAATLQRFVAACDADPNFTRLHPLFGVMPAAAWQRGNGLHIEHHLKQFGA